MSSELRLPIALWALGSAALFVWSLQFEAAVIVSSLYISLNGASFFLTAYRDPPVSATMVRVMAWCTAAQLPVMLVLIYDGAGSNRPGAPEKKRFFDNDEASRDAGRFPPARQDPRPERSDRPGSEPPSR